MALPPSRIWSPFCTLPDDRTNAVTIVRGEGAYIYDAEGNRYLDGTAGLWYTLIGHGREEMAAAIADQVRTLHAFKTHGEYDNLPARALAEELTTMFPVDDSLAFFTSGGGDSIESACKLARSYWEVMGAPSKKMILTRENAYHGMHGFGTRISGIEPLRRGSEDGYPADVVAYNDIDALEKKIIDVGSHHIAAFIAEPVIGAGGVFPPAKAYLKTAQDLCREHDILFVSDEVITGFGRMGMWSGAEYYGLTPDIMALAKGITSGYVPLGAILAARRIWEEFQRSGAMFRHGYTYSGHPTACAAAIKNLEILRAERLLEHAVEMGALLQDRLAALVDEPLISEVRGVGLMAGIGLDREVVAANGRSSVDLGAEMVKLCRERGVIVRRMFQGDLQISPPLIVDQTDIDRIRDAVRDAARELHRRVA